MLLQQHSSTVPLSMKAFQMLYSDVFDTSYVNICTALIWYLIFLTEGQILFGPSWDVDVISSHYIVNVLFDTLSICNINQVHCNTYFDLKYVECSMHHMLFFMKIKVHTYHLILYSAKTLLLSFQTLHK
jgi:hypothetical protein